MPTKTTADARDLSHALYRDMDLRVDRAATLVEGEMRIPIALSSETPVERYDPWTDERFMEVLDHSPESIDLSYARDGMPFLLNHDTRDQIGIIEDISLGADRRLRGMVRFSRSQGAQEIKQDIVDGIRKKISVGYRIDPLGMDKTKPEGATMATMRATRWTPLEASSVPIPADYAVGVGRSAITTPAPKGQGVTVAENNTAADPGAVNTDETVNRTAVVSTRERSDNEVSWADVAMAGQIHSMQDQVSAWQADGKQPREIMKSMADIVRQRMKDGPVVKPRVELSVREEKEYSWARAILSSAEGTGSFERDISQQIARNLPTGYKQQGTTGEPFYIPTTIGQRAGLDSITSTKGTELKFIQAGSFIDMLRNRARVMQLGATVLAGLDGPVTFPVQNGAGTATWMAENSGSDVSDSNLTLTTRTLTAKTLMSSTSFSRQLLRQSVIDVENLVRADLAAIHAIALDLAAIAGTGASNQPTGILTNTSVGVYTLGAQGGTASYTMAVGLEFTVENANATVGQLGYLSTPGIKATLKTVAQLTNTSGIPVWTGGQEGVVNGYPAYSSKQVPSNLTKGTQTTVCHAVLFGAWSQLYIGEWGALEIITDPYRLKKQGMIELTSFQMADIMLRYPEAFAVTKDALSAF
jgi:HK97 family phage major capsid protein